MKMSSFNARSALLFILGGIILILTVVSGCLYRQVRSYHNENRELIIQNDSIISANIELTNAKKERSSSAVIKKSNGKF